MVIPPERSSAVLAKVSSKSCLSAIVDARLVDSRIIVYYANKAAWHAHKTRTQIHKDKNTQDKIELLRLRPTFRSPAQKSFLP